MGRDPRDVSRIAELEAELDAAITALGVEARKRGLAEAECERLRGEIVRLNGRTIEAFVLARLETEMIDPSLPPDLHEQALTVIAELRKNRRDLGGGGEP